MDTNATPKEHRAAPAVSVVIPVYNLEGYLAPCLESVRGQSFADFEAIVDDDGSKDGSLAEIRRLTAGDGRFVVLPTENRGVARAREAALAQARGRYVCFLDGGDWWERDMLERMVAAIEERGGCDIVCGNYIRVCATYRSEVRERRTADLEGLGYLREVMTFGIAPSLWGKLFRRTLFDGGLKHYPMRRGQDTLVNIQIACRAPRVRFIDYAGYNYLQRPGSEIHSRLSFDYCRSYAEAVDDIFGRYAARLAGSEADLCRTVNALWWYIGYINRSSNPWRGDDPYVVRLRDEAARHRHALNRYFSRGELLMFDLDRWRAMRPAVILLLTLRRWRTSLVRRMAH